MNRCTLSILASGLAFGVSSMAVAAEPPSQEEMWKILQEQRQEIAELKKRLGEKETPTPVQKPEAKEPSLKWADRITVGGSVEVEAGWNNNHDGDFSTPSHNASDIAVSEAELTIDGTVNEWVKAKVVLLHEEGAADKIDLDAANITIGNSAVTPLFLSAGRMTVPFGSFETLMVADPLTLDIGETKESAVQVGFESGSYGGSVYLFKGDGRSANRPSLDEFGASLSYTHTYDFGKVGAGADFISALEDSGGITDSNVDETTLLHHIPGLSLHSSISVGPWTLLGEYVSALKRFDANDMLFNSRGARPYAFNAEVGYSMDIMGKEGTMAVGYQQTGESLGLGLPRSRIRSGLSVGIFENTDLAFEWSHDKDYKKDDSSTLPVGMVTGTSDDSNSATVKLAVSF